MNIPIDDAVIDYLAEEYQKSEDAKLLAELNEKKLLQISELLEIAKDCGLETFQDRFNAFLRKWNMLN